MVAAKLAWMDTPTSGRLEAIERARYKLRQADMALRYLRHVPTEIAADLRRARPISDSDLRLDTFFFSCLGLCKSAYYIIRDEQGSRYKNAIHSWRMNVLDHRGRTQFNRMMTLRDNEELLHYGRSKLVSRNDSGLIGAIEIAAGDVLRERSFPELL